MASVKKLLLNSLKELVEAELKEFKWHLKNDEHISNSEMENADVFDTVDLMTKRFGPEEAVKITVKILREMKQKNLAEKLENNHKSVIVPRTRNDFLQYSHQFTLDLNTANDFLYLSEENREITATFHYAYRPHPDHPDKFDVCQVLCRESVCGRCYWEIEWSGHVYISVSYKSISRKGGGNECRFGSNDQSWSLFCSSSSYSFIHSDIETKLPVEPISSRVGVYDDDIYRVGVYVDHSAGTLSFYSVSGDTMSLIHTVQTTFTQRLYPGFRFNLSLCRKSSVKLC